MALGLGWRRLTESRVLMSVKDDVLIDLIGYGDHVVLDAEGGDLSELLL